MEDVQKEKLVTLLKELLQTEKKNTDHCSEKDANS